MVKKLTVLLLFLLPASLFSQNFDVRLLHKIYTPHSLQADKYFLFVTNYSFYAVIAAPVGMGAAGLISHDDKLFRNACVTLTATALNIGVTTAIKYSVNRKRPDQANIGVVDKSDFNDPSFPSGHTSSAFATATSMSFAYPYWYVIIPTYTAATAIGYSRIYLGGHYPSDVLAGALIGSGCAWLTYAVNKKLIRNHEKKIEPASGL